MPDRKDRNQDDRIPSPTFVLPGSSLDTEQRILDEVEEIRRKLEELSSKIDLIFGDSILIGGRFVSTQELRKVPK